MAVSVTESLKVLPPHPWRPTLVLSTEKYSKVFLEPDHIMLGDRNQRGKTLSPVSDTRAAVLVCPEPTSLPSCHFSEPPSFVEQASCME